MELNGLQIGKQIMLEFKIANTDGSFRANAVNHVWFVVPSSITHRVNNSVKITGLYSRSQISKMRSGKYQSSRSYYNPSGVPDSIPFYAEVLVIDND